MIDDCSTEAANSRHPRTRVTAISYVYDDTGCRMIAPLHIVLPHFVTGTVTSHHHLALSSCDCGEIGCYSKLQSHRSATNEKKKNSIGLQFQVMSAGHPVVVSPHLR